MTVMQRLILFVLIGIIGVVGYGTILRGQTTSNPISYPTDSSLPEVQAPTPERAMPVHLSIAAIGVDARMESVGLDEQKRMAVPSRDELVGWYALGAYPGEMGSAVLAGHFDAKDGSPAVFSRLDELRPGDDVIVTDTEGRQLEFEVISTEIFPDADFPIPPVFGRTDLPRLNLITCDGVFDTAEANYMDRLVVFTRLKT